MPDLIVPEGLHDLIHKSKVPRALIAILAKRGFKSIEEARHFLEPQITSLHDPFLMSGMHEATQLLQDALRDKKKIMLHGDYDVDGLTSVALLHWGLSDLGCEPITYIPDRLLEGYGLSDSGVATAIENKVDLLITVDCGISATEQVKELKLAGIKVIITDHHQPPDELPPADAILNPSLPGDTYPFPSLAGVGVAFKLLHGLYRVEDLPEEDLFDHLDLVALGTIADIVPVVDENRIFAKFGLKRLEAATKPGLAALLQTAGISEKRLTSSDVVFSLAPRINAAGRMGIAGRALALLITRDREKSYRFAEELQKENERRVELDRETFEAAFQQVQDEVDLDTKRVIVLGSKDWHPGVIGIVASRIMETFYRPAFLVSFKEDVGRGSSRGIAGFHCYKALKNCEDLLIEYGGHEFAAGFSILEENLAELETRLNKLAWDHLSSEDLAPPLVIDAVVSFDEINDELWRYLRRFEPIGPENPRPVFAVLGVTLDGYPMVLKNKHLKLRVVQNNNVKELMAFGFAYMRERLLELNGHPFDIAFGIEENYWRGERFIQLRIKDIRIP
jgi:single-stranded-DNA-specific exonuclease